MNGNKYIKIYIWSKGSTEVVEEQILFVKLNLMSKYKFSKKKGKFEASSFTWPQAFAEVVEWAEGAAKAAADDRAQDADDLQGKKYSNFLLQYMSNIIHSTYI